MKIFQCSNCNHPVFFENTYCNNCNSQLGFVLKASKMFSFTTADPIVISSAEKTTAYKCCKNRLQDTCNWLLPITETSEFCEACALNRTIPNLSDIDHYQKWQKLEIAKHRLVYQLDQFQLPLRSKLHYPNDGLCFDFLSNDRTVFSKKKRAMTGHTDGVITILLAEADSVYREQIRKQLSEPYRTLIGHFRHEVSHYYWDRLIRSDQNNLLEFRRLFGDESTNYATALLNYYQAKNTTRSSSYISKYATAHPWEDWAETWAHYLHCMDALETAYYFNLSGNPIFENHGQMNFTVDFNPYRTTNFDTIIKTSIALFHMLKSVNRSLGLADPYPFVIGAPVIEKLRFIHRIATADLMIY